MAPRIAPDYGRHFHSPPVEDRVAWDFPAWFLREFVDQLGLSAPGYSMPTAVEGRPPYHPSLLPKVWNNCRPTGAAMTIPLNPKPAA
jgi:hypothetical protein